ncbi:MAG: hypothetical protein A4E58_01153 [Syntrophorhabdus sp. PtaB.Bin006]|nr:MAG: hypothetical protein A4E58_01153 [Syntrophorhabdus sp. PtaB.Bin006]
MEIKGADPRDIKDFCGYHFPVIEREENVRLHACNQFFPPWFFEVLRCIYGNPMLLGKSCGTSEPYLFSRIILVGEEAGDVGPEIYEFFETDIAYLVVGKDDCFQKSSFLMMNRGLLLTSW